MRRTLFDCCGARALGLAVLAAGLLACGKGGPPTFAATRDACEGLSNVFYLVAYERDRGATKDEQLERLAGAVASPFVQEPFQTHAHLGRVVDYVYRDTESSPKELRSRIRAACRVNDAGQVSVSLAPPPS